jgi:hypothetical protein
MPVVVVGIGLTSSIGIRCQLHMFETLLVDMDIDCFVRIIAEFLEVRARTSPEEVLQ